MENEEYLKSNREKVMSPKTTKAYWCGYCDRDLMHPGEKCRTCGKKDHSRKLKKDT